MCESREQRNDYQNVNNSVSIEEGQKSLTSEANKSHICYRFPGTIKITRLSVCATHVFSYFPKVPCEKIPRLWTAFFVMEMLEAGILFPFD